MPDSGAALCRLTLRMDNARVVGCIGFSRCSKLIYRGVPLPLASTPTSTLRHARGKVALVSARKPSRACHIDRQSSSRCTQPFTVPFFPKSLRRKV